MLTSFGGHERVIFEFSHWEDVVVLKGLILDPCQIGCGGPENN